MALSKVINDLADLNQSGSTNALKGCVGTTAQQPTSSSSIDYLIVAGGGGGGGWGQAGGGGAGGYVTGSTTVYQGIPAMLTIGEGGTGGYSNSAVNSIDVVGFNGDDSGFNGVRAIGGGGGGSYNDPAGSVTITYATDGGSGGGAGTQGQNNNQFSGEYGKSLAGQGNDGGTTYNASGGGYVSPWMGAGGGGAGAAGAGGLNAGTGSGNGGVGIQIDDVSGINMISSANAVLAGIGENPQTGGIWICGGGGGGAYDSTASSGGKGGASGTTGGNATGFGYDGTDGMVNTGAGGSGASGYSNIYGGSPGSLGVYYRGGAGGSGLGILKYNNTEVTGYTLNSEDTYTVNWPADMFGMAYWPLNLDVKDVGGYYDGTATDITYVTGKFNQAASFNGSSSLIEASDPNANGGARTFSAWIKTTSGSFQGIITNGGTSHASGLNMFVYNDKLYSTSGNGTSGENYGPTSSASINTGEWVHCVLTLSGTTIGSTIKAYVNGALDGTHTTTVTITDTYDDFRIGGRYINGSNVAYFEGEIEQVRIYGSELSITEVQDIYNNSKPGSLPPIKTSSDLTTTTCNYPSGVTGAALYQFEDNFDDTCNSSGNGTGVNTPTFSNGKFGKAVVFNGTNQGMDVPSGILPSNSSSSSSVSFWFKNTANPTAGGTGMMFNSWDGNTGNPGYALNLESAYSSYPDGSLYLVNYYLDGTASGVNGSISYQDGKWHHIVVVFDISASTLSCYVDGNTKPELSISGLTTSPVDPWANGGEIGYCGPGGPFRFFNGSIDQFRIFPSALTSQQIYDLWQKENSIQTYFPNSSTDTDTLVFKSGSGQIRFHNDGPPGAEIGMLRTNTDLSSANSASGMEHFTIGGWKDFTNCTTSMCNYPITGTALYQFNDNLENTCGTPTGTGTDITYSPGQFNNAAVFNGSTSRIELGNQTWFNSGDYSVSLWLMLDGNDSDYQEFVSQRTTGDAGSPINLSLYGVSYSSNPGKLYFSIGNGGSTTNFVSNTALSKSIWYHLVFTVVAGGAMNIYIDGVIDSNSATESGTRAAPTTQNLAIGANGLNSGTTYPFNGKIDQFRVFNSALSAAQVTQLYNEVYCP